MAPSNSSGLGDYGLPLWVKMITAGLAGCWAEICTIPLDTAKVRLQIQGTKLKQGETPKYKGMFSTVGVIMKEEGPLALFKGLNAGLQRQLLYASIRIGLYDSIRNAVAGKDQNPGLVKKIMVGLLTGAIGISIASPTDVVKIRLQAEGKLPPNVPRRYNGVFDAYRKIIAADGLAGLWTGIGPNIARNAVINAAELATYDQTKEWILHNRLMKDNIFCHFLCSAWAGFVATVVGSPVDVLKTRIMNAKPGEYASVLDCVLKTLKKEGPLAFYDGFSSNANRIISWNIVMFVSLQQIRKFWAENLVSH